MIRRPPVFTCTTPRFPYQTRFRSLRLRVADREFGADFGVGIGAIACIDTAVVRPGVTVLVVDEGRAGAQFLVIRLIADPAAGVEHALAEDRKSTRLNSSH